MTIFEANFDGLVGPTHNHAGLSYGNVASVSHAGQAASPRAAALQGLRKMKALADLGLVQGVLPPQERPHVPTLRRLGITGDRDIEVITRAAHIDPTLLALTSSASAMWAANAATVSPSVDADDGRVHFTPANLISKGHRAIEAEATRHALEAVFPDRSRFVVHEPLPAGMTFADEGAANHTRLTSPNGQNPLHLFVFGRRALHTGGTEPTEFPARQTLEASQAITRNHRLDPERVLYAQQSPGAIDRGVFHHDVIGVGHENVLLVHEDAFHERAAVLSTLRRKVDGLLVVEVPRVAVPLDDAVRSYLFNSQLVRPPGDRHMTLVAPKECQEVPSVKAWLDDTVGRGGPIGALRIFDLRQSMHNGGGPACLRLRVPLTEDERRAVNPGCLLTDERHNQLVAWVKKHYRRELTPADLPDPKLLEETRRALDELTRILGLGSGFYSFQRA